MKSLIRFLRGTRTWGDIRPLMPHERMARYSGRHAEEMRQRANAGAAMPKVRLLDGRTVLIALPGRVNPLPKQDETNNPASC